MKIRLAQTSDHDAIWNIFSEVVKSGDTYAFPEDMSREDFHISWLGQSMQTYIAEDEGNILGTYIIRPNQPGRGSHIANCGYMVKKEVQGLGIGGKMCEHSIQVAKDSGYTGIQFNLVVSTNEGAISLWKKLGFKIVGVLPKAFDHAKLGLVDAFIMFQELTP